MANQAKIKGLPVYRAVLTDDGGMTKISFVDAPAVEKDFEAYAAAQQRPAPRTYAVEDEEKRLAFGVLMRANYPIYRRDDQLGEYFITHSPEFIREMVEKYLSNGLQNEFSTDHRTDVGDVYAVQFFIKDSARGISPAGFEEIEDGSLFGEFHVLNDDVWAGIKDGTFKGFSIEVYENLVPATGVVSREKVSQDVLDYLDGYGKTHKLSDNDMKFMEKIRASLAKELGSGQGEGSDAPKSETYGSVSTDKAVVHWDGDEDLEAGDEVFALNEDSERVDLADGDYTTEDGKVIVVVDGKVSEIRDAEAQVAPEEGDQTDLRRAYAESVRARYEESYDDKMRRILDAIFSAGYNEHGYLPEAGDDFAVFGYWDGSDYTDRLIRFDVSWDADGNAIVSNPVEGHWGFVADEAPAAPAAAEPEQGEDFEARFEALETRLSEVADAVQVVADAVGENNRRMDEFARRPLGGSARDAYRKNGGSSTKTDAAGAMSEIRDILRKR